MAGKAGGSFAEEAPQAGSKAGQLLDNPSMAEDTTKALPAPNTNYSPTGRTGIDPDLRKSVANLPAPEQKPITTPVQEGQAQPKRLSAPNEEGRPLITTPVKSIRPIMESKYDTPMNKAQSIKEPIIMPKVPTQAEIDRVNSSPKSAKDRAEIVRILKRYNVPSLNKFNQINKGLPGAKK